MAGYLCQCARCRLIYTIPVFGKARCLDCNTEAGQRVVTKVEGEVF